MLPAAISKISQQSLWYTFVRFLMTLFKHCPNKTLA